MTLKAFIAGVVCFNLSTEVPSAICPAHHQPYLRVCPSTGCTDSDCCEHPPDGCSRVSMLYRSPCNAHSYWDPTKAGTTAVDCCTFKANCRGHTCPAGYKPKINAAMIYCNGSSSTCTNDLCCDGETTKCAGNVVPCLSWDTYRDTAKVNTIATNATAATVCCSQRATCNDYTCPSGYTIRTNPSMSYCPGASTSCSIATCCVADSDKCAGKAPKNCAYGYRYFWDDTAKGGVIPITPGIDCCSPKPTCKSYSCAAGKVKIATKCNDANSSCTDSLCCTWIPSSTCTSSYICPDGYKFKLNAAMIHCASSGCNRTNCCDKDATKCGGLASDPCTGATYHDIAKAGIIASPTSVCCTALVTCDLHVCAPGYKLKINAPTRYCPSSLATCTTGVCCDPDGTKCAGLLVSPCISISYYLDTAKAGNAVGATVASAAAACCSVRSTCVGHVCAAGYKAKVWPQTIICPGDSTTCLTSACCEADVTKCGGVSPVSCTYGNLIYYWDTAKAGTTFDVKATDCCTLKAICSAAYRSAGVPSTTSGMARMKLSRHLIIAALIFGLVW